MSNSHWFVEAMSELAEEAKLQGTTNVLPGLRTALEVFCVEADLSEEDTEKAKSLFEIDTGQGVNIEAHSYGVLVPVGDLN